MYPGKGWEEEPEEESTPAEPGELVYSDDDNTEDDNTLDY